MESVNLDGKGRYFQRISALYFWLGLTDFLMVRSNFKKKSLWRLQIKILSVKKAATN